MGGHGQEDAPEERDAARQACSAEAASAAKAGSSPKPAQERAPREKENEKDTKEEHNDLIVEQWQAPKLDKMKGESREVWEYESEKGGPSGTLWIYLVAIIVGLLGGLVLIFYTLSHLLSLAGPGGP